MFREALGKDSLKDYNRSITNKHRFRINVSIDYSEDPIVKDEYNAIHGP